MTSPDRPGGPAGPGTPGGPGGPGIPIMLELGPARGDEIQKDHRQKTQNLIRS